MKNHKLKELYKNVSKGKLSLNKYKDFKKKIDIAMMKTLEEIEKENSQ